MKGFFGNIAAVASREWRRIADRPILFVAPLATMAFCCLFFTTFLGDGLPHDLPIGIVDEDNSSVSRNFRRQLDATQLGSVVEYDDVHSARADMQSGRITSFCILPKGMGEDIGAGRQPKMSFYVNTLYFVGGSLAWKDILTMAYSTSGAVQKNILEARGMTESQAMAMVKPIVIDTHQIGNPTTNYGIYLNNILLPGILILCILVFVVYAFGIELKEHTSAEVLEKEAGGSFTALTLGKLVPYTVYFTALAFLLDFYFYHWLHYPMAGSVGNMLLLSLVTVLACEATAVFILGCTPILRLAISVAAIYGILGFSFAGFTFPVEAMPVGIQGMAVLFPLRYYYLFFVQEAVFGSGFAGWWLDIVILMLFFLTPLLSGPRLKKAYVKMNFPRL